MAQDGDLTTVARVAARLKVTEAEPGLAELVTTASELVRDWVGYPLHKRTGLVETCAGGALYLFLRSGAVRAVSSITVFGAPRDASTWALDDAVKGVIRSTAGLWPFTGRTGGGISEAPMFREDTGQIAVTFDAGWVTPGQVELAKEANPGSTLTSDLPAVFEQAALVTVDALFHSAGQNPHVTSQSLGSGSVDFGSDASRGGRPALPLVARAMVSRYRMHSRGTP